MTSLRLSFAEQTLRSEKVQSVTLRIIAILRRESVPHVFAPYIHTYSMCTAHGCFSPETDVERSDIILPAHMVPPVAVISTNLLTMSDYAMLAERLPMEV